MTAAAQAAAIPVIGGWPGTGAGLLLIGACAVILYFAPRLVPRRFHKHAHPWLHRAITVLMYCGACALLVTGAGHWLVSALGDVTGPLGGLGSGAGRAAIDIVALFLALTVLLAVTTEPAPRAGWYAVLLVIVLALVPGGWPAHLLAVTSRPGQAVAASVASWFGGR